MQRSVDQRILPAPEHNSVRLSLVTAFSLVYCFAYFYLAFDSTVMKF